MPMTLAHQINRLGIKTMLVTNMFMNEYSGSPIVALDVALAFKAAGVDVTIASSILRDPMLSKVEEAGITSVDISSGNARRTLEKSYDLIWGQHWPIYDLILCELGTQFSYLIISCLSPHEPLESISPSWQIANKLLFNSAGTLERAAPTAARETKILPNSLPIWWRDGWSMPSNELRRIAIVSNNKVRDIEDAIPILRARYLEIEQIGMSSLQREVTPELIDSFDAVITIGHTVQKALFRRRPVYVYDRFGGFGWLVPEIAESALKLTFSGRGHGRQYGASIAKQIVEGFEHAVSAVTDLGKWADANFDLEANLSSVLAQLEFSSRKGEASLDTRRHQAAAAKLVINLHVGEAAFNPVHDLYLPRNVRFDVGPPSAPTMIETFWPRKVDGWQLVMEHEDVFVQGALMLSAPHEIDRLTLTTTETVVVGRHGLSSGHLEKHRPGDKRYLNARFEIAVPANFARGSGVIEAQTKAGEKVTIAEIIFQEPLAQ